MARVVMTTNEARAKLNLPPLPVPPLNLRLYPERKRSFWERLIVVLIIWRALKG